MKIISKKGIEAEVNLKHGFCGVRYDVQFNHPDAGPLHIKEGYLDGDTLKGQASHNNKNVMAGILLDTEVADGLRKAATEIEIETEKAKAEKITIQLSTRGWGDFYPVKIDANINDSNNDILAKAKAAMSAAKDADQNPTDQQIMDMITEAKSKWNSANNKQIEAKQAIENLIEKAKQAGAKQVVKKYMSNHCLDNLCDCSFDSVTVWIDEAGNQTETHTHCF